MRTAIVIPGHHTQRRCVALVREAERVAAERTVDLVVFTGWAFYGLGALGIFALRRRFPDAPRSFRVPGYPITPVLFVASAALLVLNTIITQPTRAAAGIAVVLLGTPAFYVWRARARSRDTALSTAG